MYLLGPHLEHPHYFKANTLIAEMIYHGISESENNKSFPTPSMGTSSQKEVNKLWRDIKAELSNSRIVALSLEKNPITWRIGKKVYEPVKIRAFLEIVWSRFPRIGQLSGKIEEDKLIKLRRSFREIAQILREIKRDVDKGYDTTDKISNIFIIIKDSCAEFFRIYFNNKLYSLRKDYLIR